MLRIRMLRYRATPNVPSNAAVFSRFVEQTFFDGQSPDPPPPDSTLNDMADAARQALERHKNIQPYPFLGLWFCVCKIGKWRPLQSMYIVDMALLASPAFSEEVRTFLRKPERTSTEGFTATAAAEAGVHVTSSEMVMSELDPIELDGPNRELEGRPAAIS
jgi:hypothetical protein